MLLQVKRGGKQEINVKLVNEIPTSVLICNIKTILFPSKLRSNQKKEEKKGTNKHVKLY